MHDLTSTVAIAQNFLNSDSKGLTIPYQTLFISIMLLAICDQSKMSRPFRTAFRDFLRVMVNLNTCLSKSIHLISFIIMLSSSWQFASHVDVDYEC